MNKHMCEFCGKLREVASTTFVSNYCAECHEINVEQSEEALQEIQRAARAALDDKGE